MCKDNKKLAEFELSGIPPMRRGQPQIQISYDIDANGILTVSAVEKSTGSSKEIKVENDSKTLNQEDIDRMVAEAEKYAAEDEKVKKKIEAKNQCEGVAYQMKDSLDNFKDDQLDDEKKQVKKDIEKECDDLLAQCAGDGDAEHFEKLSKEFQDKVQGMMAKLAPAGAGEAPPYMSGMPDMSGMGGMPPQPPAQEKSSQNNDDQPEIEEID